MKSTAPISRVLCQPRLVPAIYLLHESPHGWSILPSIVCLATLGRTALRRWYTWTCSPQMEQHDCRQPPGGLLHHLLTLTLFHKKQGGHSLLPYPTVANSLYFRKWGVLRCPDFPLTNRQLSIIHFQYTKGQRQTGTLLFDCKISVIWLKCQMFLVKNTR